MATSDETVRMRLRSASDSIDYGIKRPPNLKAIAAAGGTKLSTSIDKPVSISPEHKSPNVIYSNIYHMTSYVKTAYTNGKKEATGLNLFVVCMFWA